MRVMEKRVKYPIGIQDFESLRSMGYLYVDKTAIIYELINRSKYVFLSRPRRFGKSLTLSTLKAYFEGNKELFEGLAVSRLEKEWPKHPVFLLSFGIYNRQNPDSLKDIFNFYLSEWEREYGIEAQSSDIPVRFAKIVKSAVEQTGEKAVVLIDEYDNALVSILEDPELHSKMKETLKPFYTVLKDLDSHIRFAMITGITRFSKMTIFSGLNNLNDISLDEEYTDICGITPQELEEHFHQGIEEIGQRYSLNYEEALKTLKDYYDGYHFSSKLTDIYNPFSILNALSKSKLGNYWFSTGIPSFIVERMKSRELDLEKYMNQESTENVLKEADSAYSSDLAILFQAGFLTIKKFVPLEELYKLGIPNREVREGMSKLFMDYFLIPKDSTEDGSSKLREMVRALKAGEPETFLKLLKSFFAGVPFELSRGDKEIYFHNAFYIITNLIGLNVQAERHTSAGSIDLLLSTPEYIYVIEIKMNKKAEEALCQIDSKEYALAWETDGQKVYKIGVSFSSRTRNLREWIVES